MEACPHPLVGKVPWADLAHPGCVAVPERYNDIDHLVIGKFVTRPLSYRLVTGQFAYSSWIFINAENKENAVLFDSHVAAESGRF